MYARHKMKNAIKTLIYNPLYINMTILLFIQYNLMALFTADLIELTARMASSP